MTKSSLSTFVLSLIATTACVAACGGSTAGTNAGGGTADTADSGTGSGTAVTKDSGATAPVDNGAPSETYPAPHPAAPQLANLGGDVMTAPHLVPVFFPNDPDEANLLSFTKSFPTSSFFAANTSEYGVGLGTAADAVDITEVPPTSLNDSDIQTWIAAQIDKKTPGFDGAIDKNTLFILYYPQTTTISLSGGGGGGSSLSCQSFGGYHDSFTHGGQEVAYAVVPRCPGFAGKGQNVVDVTTGSTSHEILEAATDPHPQSNPAYGQPDDAHVFWEFLLGGGEDGDMCAQFPGSFVKDTGVGFTVQRSWSNKAAAAGHDPCVPQPAGEVYFNSAVKLPDTADLGGGFSSPAITMPIGGSKTVEVDLFSDAKTSGAWTVEAFDESSFGGGPSSLDFSWDRDSGLNGEKLHLTVTLKSKPQQGAAGFFIVSKLGKEEHMWLGLVAEAKKK